MTSHSATTHGPAPTELRDKLAQLIFVRIGSNLPPVRTVEEDVACVARLLESCPVGGLLVFNGGLAAKQALERLQRIAAVPLLVAADVERGVGQQVKGLTRFPHAMAFGRVGINAPAAVAAFAEVTAREARDVGIHISFGPVADVNTNPRNPIIATRAFSERPERAAELAAGYVTAAEAAGLRTTAKHFPGHGDTHQDSHDSLPSVTRSLDELEACELVPFRAAVDAGCSLVMTAHVAYPAIDPSGAPATLSRIILNDVLRGCLRFRGVICSDSLLMAGVRDRFETEEELALAALTAGVDLLIDLRDPLRVIEHLCRCVEHGTLSQHRVDEALQRVWALKQRTFAEAAHIRAHPGKEPLEPAAQLAERIARNAIETIGDSRPALPFNAELPLTVILLKPFESAIEPPEQPLAGALRSHFHDVRYVELGPRSNTAEIAAAYELARGAKQLLLAMVVRPAAWHAFGLLPEQREFLHRLTRECDTVLASLGVPYALNDFPDASVRICTYSDVPVSQQVLAEFLIT
jgi:beta-glucosidase-like glycosyl hydrolase